MKLNIVSVCRYFINKSVCNKTEKSLLLLVVVASDMDALNTVTEIIQVYQKCTSTCVCHWWTDDPFVKWATNRQKRSTVLNPNIFHFGLLTGNNPIQSNPIQPASLLSDLASNFGWLSTVQYSIQYSIEYVTRVECDESSHHSTLSSSISYKAVSISYMCEVIIGRDHQSL